MVTTLPVAAALPADDARVTALAEAHAALLPEWLYGLLEAHRGVGCLRPYSRRATATMPLLFRRRVLKGAPAAKLIYCSDLAQFHASTPAVARFLFKQGVALLISDDHGFPLRAGQFQRPRGLKFARPGAGLEPAPTPSITQLPNLLCWTFDTRMEPTMTHSHLPAHNAVRV